MTTTDSSPRPTRPVFTGIGEALGTDYFLVKSELTKEEVDFLERTRRYVHEEVLPVINDYWERAEVPLDLYRRLGELGLVGDGLEGYGCPPMSATESEPCNGSVRAKAPSFSQRAMAGSQRCFCSSDPHRAIERMASPA